MRENFVKELFRMSSFRSLPNWGQVLIVAASLTFAPIFIVLEKAQAEKPGGEKE